MSLIYKNEFTPLSNYGVYPPYAEGAYIEEYFATRFYSERPKIDRQLINVFWTPYYLANKINRNTISEDEPLQHYLNSLTNFEKYFLVCQHDDAPLHKLPNDTLVFSAGGMYDGDNVIPIPLICSKIPNHLIPIRNKQDLFCSFVGSHNQPIRHELINAIKGKPDTYVWSDNWNPNVSEDNLNRFLMITSDSEFCLCPRGYGKTSFRLYEAMQLGSIPVYISDDFYLPWSDELDWSDFAVLIKREQIPDLYDILKSISEDKKDSMRQNIKHIYSDYFTLNGTYDNIIKRLK